MRKYTMAPYDRFDSLDPATKRGELAKMRRGLSASLFDGTEPHNATRATEPVPIAAEAFHTDPYKANNVPRSNPRNIGVQAVHGAEYSVASVEQTIPTAHTPKAH